MKYYLISLDCESTGLSVYNDQIVELGAAFRLWDSTTGETSELSPFAEYAKPTVKTMCKKAEEITHISMVMLQDKPPINTVLGHFMKHVDMVCTQENVPRLLLSYNGFAYDIPLIVAEVERSGGSAVGYFRKLRIHHAIDVLPFGRACIDTSILRRRANGSCSYRLGDVYAAVCKCPLLNAHGALADSNAVLDIIQCGDIQRAFQSLLEGEQDNKQCQNPMSLVRSVVSRLEAKSTMKKPTTTQSRRVMDMFRDHAEKKRKRGTD